MIAQIVIYMLLLNHLGDSNISDELKIDCKKLWNSSEKLKWSDFNTPNEHYSFSFDPSNGHADAVSYINTEVHYSFDKINGKTNLTAEIEVFFDCNKSWVKNKKDKLLEHEQLHFDISELYARKLRKAISKKRFNRSTYSKDVNKIKSDLWVELHEFQHEFDQETDFSRNTEMHDSWKKIISRELEKLQTYDHANVIMRVKL